MFWIKLTCSIENEWYLYSQKPLNYLAKVNEKILFSIFTLISIIFGSLMLSFFIQSAYNMGHITFQPMQNGYNISKVIILAFDDSPTSQYTLTKPILGKYGFKGSFLQFVLM